MKFDPTKHNVYNAINPVVAALFLSKIDALDKTMLYGNIGNIVNSRFNKKPLQTSSDLELFNNLIRNSYDVVCDRNSPIKDLKNRFILQTALWDCVVKLRQGRPFDEAASTKFNVAIDNCKVMNYDAPDLLYFSNEGVMTRRLLNSFSLRPTIIQSISTYNVFSGGVLTQTNGPLPSEIPMISQIPMLNVNVSVDENKKINLIDDALSAPEYILEKHNLMLPRTKKILYTQGLLMVHLNRRYNRVDFNKVLGRQQFAWQNLPTYFPNIDTISTSEVQVDWHKNVGRENQRCKLTSVVCILVDENINPNKDSHVKQGVAIGNYCINIIHPDQSSTFTTQYVVYDPIRSGNQGSGAAVGVVNPSNYRGPYVTLDESEAARLISKYGTVFIYTTDEKYNKDNLIFRLAM